MRSCLGGPSKLSCAQAPKHVVQPTVMASPDRSVLAMLFFSQRDRSTHGFLPGTPLCPRWGYSAFGTQMKSKCL
jgi:hypothetical protein